MSCPANYAGVYLFEMFPIFLQLYYEANGDVDIEISAMDMEGRLEVYPKTRFY